MRMQLPGDGARCPVTVLAVSDFTLLASSTNIHQLITPITCGVPACPWEWGVGWGACLLAASQLPAQ